jgi:predicted nucleic acid-binding protein
VDRLAMVLVALLVLCAIAASEELMVYTANQGFLSRIYVLDMNANVLRYFEYSYEHTWLDLEVVDNEVYALDWVTAAVYRVNLDTGAVDLTVARRKVEAICSAVPAVYPGPAFAALYGRSLATLQRSRRVIATMDLLIATAAMESAAPLVTRNVGHFQRVDGLRVLSY